VSGLSVGRLLENCLVASFLDSLLHLNGLPSGFFASLVTSIVAKLVASLLGRLIANLMFGHLIERLLACSVV